MCTDARFVSNSCPISVLFKTGLHTSIPPGGYDVSRLFHVARDVRESSLSAKLV